MPDAQTPSWLRAVRCVAGTPAVLAAFVAAFVIELLVVATIIGIAIIAEWHEEGGTGAFGPALTLARLVYA